MSLIDIQLLVFLYEAGMNKSSLARFFNKDHSTVIHHVQKYHAQQVKPLPKCGIFIFHSRPKPVSEVKDYAYYANLDHQRASKLRHERAKMISNGHVDGCRVVDVGIAI